VYVRILLATVLGITAANAGFAAGMVGTILVGPWAGMACPALTMGYATGTIAMLASFTLALRRPSACPSSR
jgi:hypothetical protein